VGLFIAVNDEPVCPQDKALLLGPGCEPRRLKTSGMGESSVLARAITRADAEEKRALASFERLRRMIAVTAGRI